MIYRLLAFTFTLATALVATTASQAPLIVERDESPPINTPEPVLLPMIPYCEQFHLIQPGETCPSIASSVGLTTQELRGLNEFLGVNNGDCAKRLMAGYWCCVKARDGVLPIIRVGEVLTKLVGGLKPTRRSTRPPASTKTVVVEKPKPAEPDSPPLATGINTDVCDDGAYCPDFLHPGK